MAYPDLDDLMREAPPLRRSRLLTLRSEHPAAFSRIARVIVRGDAGDEGLELLANTLIQTGRFGSFLRTECPPV